MRETENMLRERWADRLLNMLIPHRKHYVQLDRIVGISGSQHAHRVFGNARWGTLRTHPSPREGLETRPAVHPMERPPPRQYMDFHRKSGCAKGAIQTIPGATFFVGANCGEKGMPAHSALIMKKTGSLTVEIGAGEIVEPRQATTLNWYELLDLAWLAG